MSKCFEIEISEHPEQLITRAKGIADRRGVNFRGNACTGTFSGQGLQGEYQLTGTRLAVTVKRKPMILPWAMVESALKQFFA